ncbi:MAG: FAD-dependent oxidoreductase [Ktedonobacterales bacterium]
MHSVGATEITGPNSAHADGAQPGQKVVVVGGGLAGLTAAKTLVDAGLRVELLESRALLGGKVSSWRDEDGDWVESGLHVFFGAYREIFDLMRELGIYDNVLWKEHVLKYTMAGGDSFEFRTLPLPSPLHLLPAVFGNRYFSTAEKLTLARALPSIVLANDAYYRRQDAYTYAEWHLGHGISHKMLARMFLPVALALKFLPPEELSAKVVLDVSGIFLRENGASRMGFLSGSPQDKLIGPLADYIQRRGGTIRTGAAVRALLPDAAGRLAGVRLASGEEIRGDRFVLALPVHKLNQLVPTEWRQEHYWERLSRFEGVPVMTVQLWLDRQVTGIDNILFSPDGHIPVYADLGNTTPDYAVGGRSRIEAVVAPARPLWNWDDADVVGKVWDDVRSAFPGQAAGARVVKSTLVRIPQSVYWPKPGLDALRPTQRTPVTNLYLAGGYTIQRFYDSMEGAVSSGRLAARAVLDDTDVAAQLATSAPRLMLAQP